MLGSAETNQRRRLGRSVSAKVRLTPAKIFFLINLLFIGVIFILGFRPGAFLSVVGAQDLAAYNGRYLTLTGRVCEEADLDYKSRRLTLCVEGGLNGSPNSSGSSVSGRTPGSSGSPNSSGLSGSSVSGQVLVTADLYPTYDYGDFLQVNGELQAPPEIDGFDYVGYLARYDIYSVMYYPKIMVATGTLTGPQRIYHGLINLKQYLKSLMDASLPEPAAGLADALLLGYRRTVDQADLDVFARVGLSHMIAISGSHITILSAMIVNFFLALGFSRRRSLRFIFAFLFIYPLITGLAASAVRSAIMGGLAFLAVYYGRSSSLIKALVFSAAIMLAFNPLLLRADIGFQLSFLAILGIIYIYPLGEELVRRGLSGLKLSPRLKSSISVILETINLTLVSQIVILPIALINFKQLSLIAPLANVLVLWTFPLLLASLIVALFLSAILPAGGVLWFFLSYLLLKFIFIVSGALARPDWAAVMVTNFNWYGGAVYYLFLWLAVKIFRKVLKI